ncbi:MAG: 50S ribosomal protein L33 [Myxococcales bacterium]|nr:50S ribosomal protein L33 [Polyangiaceae bacterium]MDW8251410.1 50S ribosomal protein L33 [Myxococcales bacterium]
MTRVPVALSCSVCGERNYKTTRVQRRSDKPLELKKFCKKCNRHTIHRESK